MKKSHSLKLLILLFWLTYTAFSQETFDHKLSPALPENIQIESSSLNTLKNMQKGNALSGIMDIHTGQIYLIPVSRRDDPSNLWIGSDWEGEIKVLDTKVEQIIHEDNGLTSHEQTAQVVDRLLNREYNRDNWIGFGVRKKATDDTSAYITFRSRSLNDDKFFYWVGGNQDIAFTRAYELKESMLKRKYKKIHIQKYEENGLSREEASQLAETEANRIAAEDMQNYRTVFNFKKEYVTNPISSGHLGSEYKSALEQVFNDALKGSQCSMKVIPW